MSVCMMSEYTARTLPGQAAMPNTLNDTQECEYQPVVEMAACHTGIWSQAAPRGSFGSSEVMLRCFDPFPGSLVLASCPLGLGPRPVSQLLSSDASMASEASSSSSSSSITTYRGNSPKPLAV